MAKYLVIVESPAKSENNKRNFSVRITMWKLLTDMS